MGYTAKSLTLVNIQNDTTVTVYLSEQQNQLEEVFVSSSRTNSRLEDLPTKVEVLGAEEVGEENGIKPGNIVSLLGDIAGIQIQQTSAATANADMRVQGLPADIHNFSGMACHYLGAIAAALVFYKYHR